MKCAFANRIKCLPPPKERKSIAHGLNEGLTHLPDVISLKKVLLLKGPRAENRTGAGLATLLTP